ncbi:hypothetical protein R69746_08160 [Paraburkholderia aspalathi]|nr:hypothetical protein R69746_08160 [Paraburkholderia aspalathi]
MGDSNGTFGSYGSLPQEEAHVTRCGTFTVRGVLYSAPSRLISHRLKVRVYGDRLDCYPKTSTTAIPADWIGRCSPGCEPANGYGRTRT